MYYYHFLVLWFLLHQMQNAQIPCSARLVLKGTPGVHCQDMVIGSVQLSWKLWDFTSTHHTLYVDLSFSKTSRVFRRVEGPKMDCDCNALTLCDCNAFLCNRHEAPAKQMKIRYPLHTWTSIAFTSHFLWPKSDKSRYCKICDGSWAAFYERDGVGLVVALPCSCPKFTQAGAQHALEVLAFTFLIVFSTCSGSVGMCWRHP